MSKETKEYDFTKAEVGKFSQRDPAQSKTCITIYLDDDVLEYFKQRAPQPNAAPYQTQINYELRAVMERGQAAEAQATARTALLTDEVFIQAVASRVHELELTS